MAKEKKKKQEFIDDGRVIADMNVEGLPGFPRRKRDFEKEKRASSVRLSFKERMAVLKALYATVLPMLAYFVLGFFLIFLLLKLIWFH